MQATRTHLTTSNLLPLRSPQIHKPEPHILLFRRALGTDPTTGKVDPALKKAALEKYQREYGM